MIEISNTSKTRIKKVKLKKIAERVLKGEKSKSKDVSVVFVSPQRMRQISKRYHRKDIAANVLSFEGGEFSLGEIVLCPLAIRKDALEYKIPFQKALSLMFVHGLLHLLGHDHKTRKEEKRMTQKEQAYLS